MSDHRYLPPQATLEAGDAPAPAAPAPGEPLPIGGWLLLVAFGLIVTPFRIVHMMFTNHWPIFRDGYWEVLTQPGSDAYHALWGPIIVFEIVGNVVLVALVAFTLAMFFKKSRKTPRLVIAWHVFGLLFLLVDEVLGRMIPAVANNPEAGSMKEVVRSVIGAAIWIPYFLLSQRVKKTFIR